MSNVVRSSEFTRKSLMRLRQRVIDLATELPHAGTPAALELEAHGWPYADIMTLAEFLRDADSACIRAIWGRG